MVERYVSMRRIEREKADVKRKIHFSGAEIKDLVKAWVILSLAFAILLSGFESTAIFISVFIMSLLTVGIGFLFHEMAHKIVAQHYGCWAEFRAFNNMLILALVMSLFGFLLAAPGAVMISGFVDRKRNGKISLAGPLTNMVLAALFFALYAVSGQVIGSLAFYGYRINALLAIFNLIPFGIFDGSKVLAWDKKIYAFAVIVGLLLFAFPYFI